MVRQAVIDIINFKLFTSNKVEKKLIKLIEIYKDKVIPTMPIGANILMKNIIFLKAKH
jgi:poly(A) polymerase